MHNKLIAAALALSLAALVGKVSAESISCVLENNKVLTLSNLSTTPTYSYGTAGKIELALPNDSTRSQVYKGREMFSGGGSQYIAFTNGVYTYAVYDGIGRGWELHGLRVYKNADIILERQCKLFAAVQFDYEAVNAPVAELPW